MMVVFLFKKTECNAEGLLSKGTSRSTIKNPGPGSVEQRGRRRGERVDALGHVNHEERRKRKRRGIVQRFRKKVKSST